MTTSAFVPEFFRQNRLQMIRRVAEGESVTQPPSPVKRSASDLRKPRSPWRTVPCVPLGSEPTHRALPSSHFKTLRSWRS